ncbi:SAF domain-containing protein [Arthrobacter sp. ISL-72]|uniref:SAF domain-containing protein n=1 Tax=Arthrobacter sp. ISL-72 TaxID=2819114 RepID=UPI001BE5FDEF|nr:SAF domain-containing protein [Arthrobacter sp. ISL-72]MBT2596783.1 SAF domain-containing protein [Arthrobacter sp. ISL-72]
MSSSTSPAGARLKKPSWKDPRLLLGFLLVLASVAGVVSLVGAADRTTEVYAAKGPIAVGEMLTAESVHRVKVRLGDVEPHYVTAEAGLPEGMVAVQRIGADELVPRGSLGKPDALNRKPVAITIDEALPEQAAAGSRVDVWVALPDSRNGFSEPKLLLPGAEIAEVTPGSTILGSSRSTVVLVLVTDEQMPKLLGAQANKAKISVVWNPGGGTR